MRIAQVCPRYSPYIGGVETHVEEISKRLVARGHEVTVITTDPSGKLPQSEISMASKYYGSRRSRRAMLTTCRRLCAHM